jgi:hypothetical protein
MATLSRRHSHFVVAAIVSLSVEIASYGSDPPQDHASFPGGFLGFVHLLSGVYIFVVQPTNQQSLSFRVFYDWLLLMDVAKLCGVLD